MTKIKNKIVLRYHKGINDNEMVEYYDFTKLDEYGSDYRLLCGSTFYYFNKALYEIVEITIY